MGMSSYEKAKEETKPEVIVSYKGFDQNFQCRGFQYEISKTYSIEGEIKACSQGFHACEEPFDVFGYYGPGTSRYALVEQSGRIDRDDGDSKIASAHITIVAELTLPDFIKRGVDYILARVDWKNAKEANTGYQSAATNTGDRSAATNTGNQSAATNTGYWSAATNTGYRSAATNTGYWSAATNTGYRSAATNTGYRSAATNTGNQSAATNTGYRSAATVEGKDSVALASGCEGRVSGADGCALFLVERSDNFKIIAAWAGIVGRDGIKPNTFYTLKNGQPVEVQEAA
jgi:hypothetical protein